MTPRRTLFGVAVLAVLAILGGSLPADAAPRRKPAPAKGKSTAQKPRKPAAKPASPPAEAAAAAARPDTLLYREAQRSQKALTASRTHSADRGEWERVVMRYRTVVARYPQSTLSDDALLSVGHLYRAMADRFKARQYREDALDAYGQLVAEYPRSPLGEEALFQSFEIARAKGVRREMADAGRDYLETFPEGARAASVKNHLQKGGAVQHAALPPPPPPGLAQVFNLRSWSGESSTRVVLDVEKKVEIKYERISNPDRLWIDLDATRLHPNMVNRTFAVGDGLLEKVRVGQNKDSVVRVVLDFKEAREHAVFYLENPTRLVVDVKGTPRPKMALQQPAESPGVAGLRVSPAPTASMPPVLPPVMPSAVPPVMPSLPPSSVPSLRPSVAPSPLPSAPPSLGPSAAPSLRPPSPSPTPRPAATPVRTAQREIEPFDLPAAVPVPRVSPTPQPTPRPTPVAPMVAPMATPMPRPIPRGWSTPSPSAVPSPVSTPTPAAPTPAPTPSPSPVATPAPTAVAVNLASPPPAASAPSSGPWVRGTPSEVVSPLPPVETKKEAKERKKREKQARERAEAERKAEEKRRRNAAKSPAPGTSPSPDPTRLAGWTVHPPNGAPAPGGPATGGATDGRTHVRIPRNGDAPPPPTASGTSPTGRSGLGRTRNGEPTAPHAPVANRAGNYSLARQLGLTARRIVIDAGHGGHDPGSIGRHGLQEKDLVLDVAQRVERILRSELGAEVLMTRGTDVFVPLEERTAIANAKGADLFLSIHANSSRNSAARGIETYFLNFAKDPHAEAVAARENAISAATLKDLQNLVKAITLNSKVDESRDFAASIQEAMMGGVRSVVPGMPDRGVRQAPFYVLIGANMPSILAEIAFVSNPEEEKLLKTEEHREKIAESLAAGVRTYLEALNRAPLKQLTSAGRTPRVATKGSRR